METKPAKKQYTVLIQNAILSFPDLFVAKAQEDGKTPKYGAAFLLNKKSNSEAIKAIRAKFDEIVKDTPFLKGRMPAKLPLKEANLKDYDGYDDDHMVVNGSNENRFAVINRKKVPVTKEDNLFYGGNIVNALLRFYPFSHKTGGLMICCAVEVVQYVAPGVPFGAAPMSTEQINNTMPDLPDDAEDIG